MTPDAFHRSVALHNLVAREICARLSAGACPCDPTLPCGAAAVVYGKTAAGVIRRLDPVLRFPEPPPRPYERLADAWREFLLAFEGAVAEDWRFYRVCARYWLRRARA